MLGKLPQVADDRTLQGRELPARNWAQRNARTGRGRSKARQALLRVLVRRRRTRPANGVPHHESFGSLLA